jgi:acetyl-CoA carboxylase carboxyl transferase subunit beta
LDEGSFVEIDAELEPLDPLRFKDRMKYEERILESQQKTQAKEAIVCGKGTILRQPIMIGVMNFEFMGGSMGSVGVRKLPAWWKRQWLLIGGLSFFVLRGGRACRRESFP